MRFSVATLFVTLALGVSALPLQSGSPKPVGLLRRGAGGYLDDVDLDKAIPESIRKGEEPMQWLVNHARIMRTKLEDGEELRIPNDVKTVEVWKDGKRLDEKTRDVPERVTARLLESINS